MSAALQILLLAMAVAALSQTLGRSIILEPIRCAVEKRFKLLGELAHCPYCQSHYIAAVAAPFAPSFFSPIWMNWIVNTLALIGLSAILRRYFYEN